MATGYTLPEPRPDWSYEAYREAFEWDIPEEYNIALECLAARDSDRSETALYHVDESGDHHQFTYNNLDTGSDALAAALADRGVTEGSHIAVCFPQSPELLVAHLATYKLGGVIVPVSVLLGRESLSYTLSHSDTEILLIDERVYEGFETDVFDCIDEVIPISIDPSKYNAAAQHLGGLADMARPGRSVSHAETSPDTPALILYTSGTSGQPKGVLHGHRYLIGSLPGFHLWFHLFDPETFASQRVWTPSEWAWAGALFDVVFPTLAIGGTVVSYVRRSKFDPEATLGFIDDTRVTRAFMPPTALSLIREAVPEPDTDLPTLDVIQSGGEPLNPDVQEWVEQNLELVVNEGYGQTEANALIGNSRALFDHCSGSMGRPYPGHDITVLDENDEPLQRGELGELAIVGPDPVFFLGYWDDPAATSEKFTESGALKTGDMVVIDDNGYVWFHGRKDDLIISSGYRISPVEVEKALEGHSLVNEAVVGGVPDSSGGTLIKAYLLVEGSPEHSGESLIKELRESVRDEIGSHKVPDEFEVLSEVPQTRSGKIDRQALFTRADGS